MNWHDTQNRFVLCDVKLNERTNGQTAGRTEILMDGRDGWKDGRTDRGTNGQIVALFRNERIHMNS